MYIYNKKPVTKQTQTPAEMVGTVIYCNETQVTYTIIHPFFVHFPKDIIIMAMAKVSFYLKNYQKNYYT